MGRGGQGQAPARARGQEQRDHVGAARVDGAPQRRAPVVARRVDVRPRAHERRDAFRAPGRRRLQQQRVPSAAAHGTDVELRRPVGRQRRRELVDRAVCRRVEEIAAQLRGGLAPTRDLKVALLLLHLRNLNSSVLVTISSLYQYMDKKGH